MQPMMQADRGTDVHSAWRHNDVDRLSTTDHRRFAHTPAHAAHLSLSRRQRAVQSGGRTANAGARRGWSAVEASTSPGWWFQWCEDVAGARQHHPGWRGQVCCAQLWFTRIIAKDSLYSITERRVPELIPVLGSQPAGDVSHKPGGKLPLLSARPAVTLATLKRAATSFAVWWTEARWVWTVCLRLLPDSVRCGYDLNPDPSAPESSTLTTRLPSHPICTYYSKKAAYVCSLTYVDGPWTRAMRTDPNRLELLNLVNMHSRRSDLVTRIALDSFHTHATVCLYSRS